MFKRIKLFNLVTICSCLVNFLGCTSRKMLSNYPVTMISACGVDVELYLKNQVVMEVDSLVLGELVSQYWINDVAKVGKVSNSDIVYIKVVDRKKSRIIGFFTAAVLGGVYGYHRAYEISEAMEGGDRVRHEKAGQGIGGASAVCSGLLLGIPIGGRIGFKTEYVLKDSTHTHN